MDATSRPLQIPPEFANYAEKHGIFEMYQRLLQQLLINRPDDPLTFLAEQIEKENDDVPMIMILGPPAAGKTSITRMICSKLRTANINADNLIEEADAELKLEAKAYISKRQDIPTEVWMKLVQSRMNLYDATKKGWVLDGFPQTRQQALAMQALGYAPKHVIVLGAQDDVLIERAVGKRIDPKTAEIYHLSFDPPPSSEIENRLKKEPGNDEDTIVDRLSRYHRNIDDLLKCFEKIKKAVNADQPKSDVFTQAYSFLCTRVHSAAPHTPRIVLLGPSGSGKAVQAALLASKYNIVNISCGQLMKQAIADETKTGQACRPYVEKGMLVPDSIALNVLKERLSRLDCVSRGWVLHGYPVTREQAEQLTYAGFIPNRVFFLDVPNDSVMERLTLRSTDPVTGDRYHRLYNPPRTQAIKDRLLVHPKDTEAHVRKQLSQYSAYVEELQDFYEDAQHVNGDQDPHTVFECLESMIVKPLPKKL